MNRAYKVINAPWHDIKISELVEIDKNFCPSYQHPEWAQQLDDDGHHRVACWTNYFEN